MAHKPAVEGLEADGRRATRRLREAPPGALLVPRLFVGRRRSAEQRTQPGELRRAEVCATGTAVTGAAVTRAAVTGAFAAAAVAIPALAAAIATSAAAAGVERRIR